MSDALKSQLEQVREQMRGKNRNNPVEAAEFEELRRNEEALINQITQASLEQTKEQKHEQLQELVRGYNFNEVFAHPDANKIIHTLLYDESSKNLEAHAQKDAEISALKQQLVDSDTKYNQAQTDLEQSTAAHAEKDAHIEKLTNDVQSMDELQKELRYERNQSAKLAAQVQDMQSKLDDAAKQKEAFAPSQSLSELVESAKAVTDKRKLANLRPADFKGSVYEGEDETGKTVQVNWLELPQIEQVQRFPEVAEQPQEVNQVPELSGEQFQAETEPQLAQGDVNGEVAEPTIETRLAALEARVNKLEGVA